VALLQTSIGLWLTSLYFQHGLLEVNYTYHALSFSLPWWGFPTPEGWNSRYHIALFFATDGTSLWLAHAITIVGLILSFWSEWRFSQARLQIPAILLVQGFALWTIFSYDLIAFYVGFEAVLFPMYYLILSLSPPGEESRRTAAEFLLYTLVGSIPMLAGILYGASEMSRMHGIPFTTNLIEWLKYPLPPETQLWVYGSFILAFWVKIGLFPLHGWVLSLYKHVPLPVVVLSSAILTKLGGMGWLRVMGAFPQGHFQVAPYVGALAVISLLGAGLGAYFQKSLRTWLSYSTISHLSLVGLGVAATSAPGVSGAAWYMTNHSLLAAAHLLIVSTVIRTTQTDEIAGLGGLARSMPQLTALWVLVALASVGLPGLSQFPGELLVFTGSYVSYMLRRAVFIAAIFSVVVSAAYTLPVLRKVLFGPSEKNYPDLALREVAPLWFLGGLMIGTGFMAAPFLEEIQRTTTPIVEAILYQTLGIR
jgi:NADH-quinone oxidoreductase subunit M